jgi:hypothetical protein
VTVGDRVRVTLSAGNELELELPPGSEAAVDLLAERGGGLQVRGEFVHMGERYMHVNTGHREIVQLMDDVDALLGRTARPAGAPALPATAWSAEPPPEVPVRAPPPAAPASGRAGQPRPRRRRAREQA